MSPEGRPHASDFSEALSEALRASPYTLSALQGALTQRGHKVSVATLSYWQTGRSLPTRAGSIATVTAIEEVLGLHPRSLTDALRAGGDSNWSPASVLPAVEEPDQVLARMGLSWSQPYTSMITYDMVHTGCPDGMERQHLRQMIRADADGIARLPGLFHTTDNGLPTIVGGDGIVIGEVVPILGETGIVVELVLPRTLKAGDLHWLEYQVAWPSTGTRVNSHGRSTKTGSNFLVLGAVFEGEQPERARFCHQAPHESASSELASWEPVPSQVQHGLRNAPAGVFELEWYLPGAETELALFEDPSIH